MDKSFAIPISRRSFMKMMAWPQLGQCSASKMMPQEWKLCQNILLTSKMKCAKRPA
ncbi:hypothetical protein SAMN05216583_105153 [Selenomonas sp. KH1T6]|nr:hypothetical protein SAMN05216583_105153 [Selenomonas ruminantium]